MSFAEKLSRLQAFLDADDLHEEALDYVATHGYLTALSICPEQVPEREWIDALFAEPPHYRSDEERQEIEVQHPQPVQIMGGTTAVTGTILPVTPTTTFTNSLATTNALLIKSTAGTLWSAVVSNTSAAARFLKFFNLTVAPTVGTSVPVFTVPIPPGGTVLVNGGSNGIRFGTGISLAITGAAGDLDTTAIGAGDVKVATTFT